MSCGSRASFTTSPIRMIAGGCKAAAFPVISLSSPLTISEWLISAEEITAVGVRGSFPARISSSTISGSLERPMRITRVPG